MNKLQQILSLPFELQWLGELCLVGVFFFFLYRIADVLQFLFVQKYERPKDLENLSDAAFLGKRARKTKRARSSLWQSFVKWSFDAAFILAGIPFAVFYLAHWGCSNTVIYWALVGIVLLLNLLFSQMFSLWTPARLASDYPAFETLAKSNLVYQAWGVVTWAGPMYIFWAKFQNNGWVGSIFTTIFFQLLQLWYFIYSLKKTVIPYQKYEGLSETFKKNLHEYLDKQGISDGEVGVLPVSIDSSSAEPNAFATGLFGYRQIVLTEGLIQGYKDPSNPTFTMKLREDTIEAITAHEVGHIRNHHIEKSVAIGMLITSIITIVVYQLFSTPVLYPMFDASTDQQIMIYWGQSIFNIMLMLPLTLLMMKIARYNEDQADQHMMETCGHKNGHDFFHQIRHIAPIANHPLWHTCNMTHPEPYMREEKIRNWDKK